MDHVPKDFSDVLVSDDKYVLLGIVRYINDRLTSSSNLGNLPMGHYTCICRRHNDYIEFNDLNKGTAQNLKLKKNRKINVEFLIYSKNSWSLKKYTYITELYNNKFYKINN